MFDDFRHLWQLWSAYKKAQTMDLAPLINLLVSALGAGLITGSIVYEGSKSIKTAFSAGFASALAAFINHLRPNPFSGTDTASEPL